MTVNALSVIVVRGSVKIFCKKDCSCFSLIKGGSKKSSLPKLTPPFPCRNSPGTKASSAATILLICFSMVNVKGEFWVVIYCHPRFKLTIVKTSSTGTPATLIPSIIVCVCGNVVLTPSKRALVCTNLVKFARANRWFSAVVNLYLSIYVRVLAIFCASFLFQSLIIWTVYVKSQSAFHWWFILGVYLRGKCVTRQTVCIYQDLDFGLLAPKCLEYRLPMGQPTIAQFFSTSLLGLVI